jgi:aldehyde:ferredoxin oxidoreductase
LFTAVTGFQIDEDHLRESAKKIWDDLKRLNEKEGFRPADDLPPQIWFKPMQGPAGEPLVLRDYFGNRELTFEDVVRLIDDYYDERGWNATQLSA